MTMQPDDWKLTAYALGELDGDERATVEAAVSASAELRASVDEIRRTADVLTVDLCVDADGEAQLTDARRATIESSATRRNEPMSTPDAVPVGSVLMKLRAPLALAASVAIVAGAAYTLLPSLSAASRPAKQYRVNRQNSFDNVDAALPSSRASTSGERSLRPQSEPRGERKERSARESRRRRVRRRARPNPAEVRNVAPAPGGAIVRMATPSRALDSDEAVPRLQRRLAYDGTASTKPGGRMDARKALESLGYIGDAAPQILVRQRSEPWNREAYAYVPENRFLRVPDSPLSTFSIDVDTASYANVRRFLQHGRLPPPGAVRIEELVNYFTYDYPEPTGGDPFSVNVEIADCPWNPDHRLARVGLKGYEIAAEDRPPANIVFLIDVSGSMQQPNKLPLLKTAMTMVTTELNDDDYVSMVVYAGSSGLVLPSTPVENRGTIISAIHRLSAGGSTNGGAGIELAYREAADNFIEGGINRVILATDGDFNVGVSDEHSLVKLIEKKAKSGVFLSVLGFGMGNYQDARLEQLADKGNGNYAYIDTQAEAEKVLVEQIGGTLMTIAKDVKIQVEFNPAEVEAYRLVGYENRMLAARDFNDDTKDAGEIGAGHTVTAFYEIVPAGVEVDLPDVDALKYQTATDDSDAAFTGELMTVKLRYKQPDGDTSRLIELPVRDTGMVFEEASDDFIFAASVASFGMLLRHSDHSGDFDLDAVFDWAESTLDDEPDPYRAEFVELVEVAGALFANRD